MVQPLCRRILLPERPRPHASESRNGAARRAPSARCSGSPSAQAARHHSALAEAAAVSCAGVASVYRAASGPPAGASSGASGASRTSSRRIAGIRPSNRWRVAASHDSCVSNTATMRLATVHFRLVFTSRERLNERPRSAWPPLAAPAVALHIDLPGLPRINYAPALGYQLALLRHPLAIGRHCHAVAELHRASPLASWTMARVSRQRGERQIT